mmetsp:Transcript_105608/g.330907  ORF Transcript_105608/g.330907 Transcript_105608/m.330907 type:complete len:216 (+) Transcript_105608:605-1252(+)
MRASSGSSAGETSVSKQGSARRSRLEMRHLRGRNLRMEASTLHSGSGGRRGSSSSSSRSRSRSSKGSSGGSRRGSGRGKAECRQWPCVPRPLWLPQSSGTTARQARRHRCRCSLVASAARSLRRRGRGGENSDCSFRLRWRLRGRLANAWARMPTKLPCVRAWNTPAGLLGSASPQQPGAPGERRRSTARGLLPPFGNESVRRAISRGSCRSRKQ